MKSKLTPCLIAVLTLLAMSCADSPVSEKSRYTGNALGTTYAITIITEKDHALQEAIDSVFYVVNSSMSTYWPDSDISRINKGDSTVVVDTMFREVFELSAGIFEATDGYFDPTVGTLVNAWGFGPGAQQQMDSITVDSLLTYVGFEKVRLLADGRIQKAHPAIYFDFNAVAKGYTLDRLGALLDKHAISDYLIELGGEILCKGTNTISQKSWTVGIDDPQAEGVRQLKNVVALQDAAMASSGNYRKFREDPETGKKYVHTVDPKTGFTKNAKVLATSVIAADCATADAYATAFMAMELEATKRLLSETTGLEAYIIYLDDAGLTSEFMTPGFESRVRR
ncbi:FAD:protein FMN transferase [Flagellimonas sp. DF-77]|uniref:FAD:protein FMN transferase n=1 Tax=Flagellimonas algarum TaxID=3230298 RepID=UPI0033960578